MPKTSRYTLVIDNVSSVTRSSDIMQECEYYGTVYDLEIDRKTRSALVEFKRSADAEYAWRKLDRLYKDGRKWKVDWVTRDDYKFFGWKWSEDTPSPSRSRRRSPSPNNSERSDSPGTPSNAATR